MNLKYFHIFENFFYINQKVNYDLLLFHIILLNQLFFAMLMNYLFLHILIYDQLNHNIIIIKQHLQHLIPIKASFVIVNVLFNK